MLKKQWLLLLLCCILATASLSIANGQGINPLRMVPDFLPTDQAFMFSADYNGGTQMRLQWHISKGYYLYKKAFFVRDESGQPLSGLIISEGKLKVDEWFGEVQVHYGEADLRVPLPENTQASRILKVTYQGCAEAGLCYPRENRYVKLTLGTPGLVVAQNLADLPASSTDIQPSASPDLEPDVETAENQLLTLLAAGSLWSILGIFFLSGIALAFTPCVLPMAPILSAMIIGGQQTSVLRASLISLAYVLGMAVVYAIAGALMGFFGASLNLQSALQEPWLLSIFSALFVALALAMFDLYELRLPVAWQSYIENLAQRRKGGFAGAAGAGALSALLVSPCISAPLAGALAYISLYQDVFIGAFALFVLALGMGVPLLLFGFGIGHLLPRAGAWMNIIKIAAGIGLLALAVWLMGRWLPISFIGFLWAALAIGTAAWLALLTFKRILILWLARLAALSIFIYGIVLVADANIQRVAEQGITADTALSAGSFVVLKDADEVRRRLATLDQPAVLYFYADWCISCRYFEHTLFRQPSIQAKLAQLVRIKADITDNTPAQIKLLDDFGLFGPPALVFFSADGSEMRAYRLQGEVSIAVLNAHLERFLADNI